MTFSSLSGAVAVTVPGGHASLEVGFSDCISFWGWLMVSSGMLVEIFYAERLSSFILVRPIVDDVILLIIPPYNLY